MRGRPRPSRHPPIPLSTSAYDCTQSAAADIVDECVNVHSGQPSQVLWETPLATTEAKTSAYPGRNRERLTVGRPPRGSERIAPSTCRSLGGACERTLERHSSRQPEAPKVSFVHKPVMPTYASTPRRVQQAAGAKGRCRPGRATWGSCIRARQVRSHWAETRTL
jgi:hypothetical protein